MSEHDHGSPAEPYGAHEPWPDPRDGGLAARIAVEVQTCPLVAGLHGGALGAIATDTALGRLVGVRIDGDAIMIGVVGRRSAQIDAIIDQVRAAVAVHASSGPVSVSVAAHHDPRTGVVTVAEESGGENGEGDPLDEG